MTTYHGAEAAAAAEREFGEALRLAPASPTVRERYAMFFLQAHGRMDEALSHQRACLASEHCKPHMAADHARLLLRLGRREAAAEVLEAAKEMGVLIGEGAHVPPSG